MAQPKPNGTYDGRPCVYEPGEAWALDEGGTWIEANSAEVAMHGNVTSEAKLVEMFGQLPKLPNKAFQEEGSPRTARE